MKCADYERYHFPVDFSRGPRNKIKLSKENTTRRLKLSRLTLSKRREENENFLCINYIINEDPCYRTSYSKEMQCNQIEARIPLLIFILREFSLSIVTCLVLLQISSENLKRS